ncbi:hypothetical protein [Actinomadura decatromicini]|uniref:Uncharacterized protein n=1 Tax=Actinomadura decatromicini TaxID=2604572 RepID=A0A5D3FZH2_9ACTN|nr:hypothetical protein [Actinomadura decatromicini]TYK53419.1 hypothetical protein FXF68_06900 [Actinomadura decatromicini]
MLSTVIFNALHRGVSHITGPPLPFSMTVRMNEVSGTGPSCGKLYLIDRTVETMPRIPDSTPPDRWWKALGAVDAEDTTIEIVLQGNTPNAVVLRNLQVEVTQRRPPARTGAVYSSGQCGGPMDPRKFSVDLDQSPPKPVPQAGASQAPDGADIEQPPINFPYKISDADPEIFIVSADTAHCDCSWHLLLTWSQTGQQKTSRVDLNGQDFRTTATEGLRHWWSPRSGYPWAAVQP